MRQMIAGMRTDKMMLFPEGTRSRDGRLQEGKRTVGKLIYTARPVVIPAAIVGTERIIPHLKSLIHGRAPVSVHYGKPVELQHYYALPDTKETSVAIVQEVMSAIASLLYNAPPALETGSVRPRPACFQGTRNGSSTV
jgi:1-acyl-sn-glycerol-3-phosphate acyltransferase